MNNKITIDGKEYTYKVTTGAIVAFEEATAGQEVGKVSSVVSLLLECIQGITKETLYGLEIHDLLKLNTAVTKGESISIGPKPLASASEEVSSTVSDAGATIMELPQTNGDELPSEEISQTTSSTPRSAEDLDRMISDT